MEATIQNAQSTMNPVEALWTLFMSQSKKVRKEFAARVIASENNVVTPALSRRIAKVEKEMKEGKTVHFDTIDQLDDYLDQL